MPHSYQLASKELAIPSIIHVRELMLDDDTFQKRLGISTRDIISQLSQRSDYIIANSIATSQMFRNNSSVKVAELQI